MGSKWLGAGLLLAIAALILGWFFGMPKIASMENDIRAALDSAGHGGYTQVEMSGNVAKLTGEAPSVAAKAGAIETAKNAVCSACKGKRSWHEVDDQMSAVTLPVQTPYTFSGVKSENGSVVLSGYVPSETDKADIILKANRIFNTKVRDQTIRVAAGAPDAKFLNVTETYMKELALLDKGKFSQEEYDGFISGTAKDSAIRSNINQIGKSLPGKYKAGFAANITVPQMAAENVGEVRSESICQGLFNDLKGNTRILFATDRAQITGAESFDLLNTLASATKQCSAFQIEIDGHTDNVGDANYNFGLSQRRAQAVSSVLINAGVNPNRIVSTGQGENQPIASNLTAQGRQQNRRVEIVITPN